MLAHARTRNSTLDGWLILIMEVRGRYCERIVSKSAPGAAKVGERYLTGVTGVRKGK